MATLILTAVLAVLLVGLLMFTRGGAREPVTAMGPEGPPLSEVKPANLGAVTERLLEARGLEIERRDLDDGSGPGYVATSRGPMTGTRVYVRAFHVQDPISAPEVISALDAMRSEGLQKLILISLTGYSDEALLAARDAPAELLGPDELHALMRDLT